MTIGCTEQCCHRVTQACVAGYVGAHLHSQVLRGYFCWGSATCPIPRATSRNDRPCPAQARTSNTWQTSLLYSCSARHKLDSPWRPVLFSSYRGLPSQRLPSRPKKSAPRSGYQLLAHSYCRRLGVTSRRDVTKKHERGKREVRSPTVLLWSRFAMQRCSVLFSANTSERRAGTGASGGPRNPRSFLVFDLVSRRRDLLGFEVMFTWPF